MFFFRYNRVLTESAGIINTTPLPEAYAVKVTPETGIMAPVIQDFQKALRKKRDTAISRFIDQEKLHRKHKLGKNGLGSNAPAAPCFLPIEPFNDRQKKMVSVPGFSG